MMSIEESHTNTISLQSSPSLKQTEFTFCNITNSNDIQKPYKDEHPFISSPSFTPTKPNHSSYNRSSTTARNKILEMMNSLPESDQELSLRDIVIDDVGKQRSMVDQRSDRLMTGLKDQKFAKRERPISRSVSLDTGVFMLKMLNPISCGTKKSRSLSRMRSKNDGFSKKYRVGSSDKSDGRCMRPNSKSRDRGACRSAEFAPGCWFINKPWKPTSQRGCIVRD